MVQFIISLALAMLACGTLAGQAGHGQPVSVSGIIYDEGRTVPVPYAAVVVKGTPRGAISAANGFFSIVALPGDTLLFSSIGYKPVMLTVPDTLLRSRVTIMVPLPADTVLLEEVVVYPWPGREQFREAFLALEVQEPYRPKMMPIPGIGPLENPIPLEPHPFWNPMSFLYDNVVLGVVRRVPKKRMAKELPEFE